MTIMKKVTCRHCPTKFTPIHSNHFFCKDSCRVGFSNKKTRRKNNISRLSRQLAQGEQQGIHLEQALREAQEQRDYYWAKMHPTPTTMLPQRQKPQYTLDHTQLQTFHQLTNPLINKINQPVGRQIVQTIATIGGGLLSFKKKGSGSDSDPVASHTPSLPRRRLPAVMSPWYPNYEQAQQQVENLTVQLQQQHDQQKTWQAQRSRTQASLNALLAADLPKPPATGKPPITTPDTRPIPAAAPAPQTGIRPSQFGQLPDHTFHLPTVLGDFLGHLERHKLAITLMGDKGAGKTTLSLHMARLLGQQGFRVAYYSLEMGVNISITQFHEDHPFPDTVEFFHEATLDQVRQKADEVDGIFVDSFSKLNCNDQQLDQLRHDFPQTILVFLLQTTTKGTPRGGTALTFDASICIKLSKEKGVRTAFMEKNRYGRDSYTYYPELDRLLEPGQTLEDG